MDAARWQRIQALFHDAADLPETERYAFLEARCTDDPSLIPEVVALLNEDAAADSVLDRGLAHAARRVLDGAPAGPQTELGPYRIKRILGEGGMGVVYLAERKDLGSLAAIKILRDAWLSPARRDRFASEQRTLAQLNHPSIARLYDADSLPDGTPWFVMEYVEGQTLTDYCAARVRTIPGRLALFRAVCEAVLHAHQHAVIHRDLKPSNILVKHDGNVKLLDFGIAKQLESLDMTADQTRTGLRLMTPAYASPEQILGGRVGVHTDIYSLGVILYELLTGRLPFDLSSRTPGEVETIVARLEPERPSIVAKRLAASPDGGSVVHTGSRTSWADLDVLCLTAMHKDPDRRYRTVEALIRDVDHFLQGEPLEARPDTMGYRLGKFVRRNSRQVAAAALALAVIIGVVVFYTMRLANARNAALAQAARTQRIQGFMTSLFEGGDETAGPAESLRVVTLLDRGIQEARTLSGEPAVQAELYQTLGSIYEKLGNLGRADSLLQAALEQRRSLFGNEHPEVARSLVALGLLRSDQADYDEAERLAREGLAMSRRAVPPDPASVARAATALGVVLENRGSYDQAIEVLTEAARLDSSAGLPQTDLVATLTELANVQFYAGHYAVSDTLNRQVLAIDRELYGEHHPHVASDLINLGAIQSEGGHYPEAERYYRQALEIYQGWYGKTHYEVASTMTMLGRVLIPQGRLDEASDLLHQALAIRESVFGKVHPSVASTLNELGRVAQQQGRLDEAEADFRRMAEIYRAVYHDKHYLIGVALSNLGSVYMDRKDHVQAERFFREAIRRYRETLSEEHLYIGIVRIKLGRSLLRQRRFADGAHESLAGYQIVAKQPDPAANWLRNARKDLVEEYESLGQADQAARFRAELGDSVK